MRCKTWSLAMNMVLDFGLTGVKREQLDASRLGHFRVISHILYDKYFLMALMERYYDDTNMFHLLIREIMITLIDIDQILQVPMKGTLAQRVTLSLEKMEEYYFWLTRIWDYQ